MSHSEPTLQEQTFRDELEKILAEFIGYPKEDDITGGFDQALTSIINLVDKELPEKKDLSKPPKYIDELTDNDLNILIATRKGYNQAIEDMRNKLKGE